MDATDALAARDVMAARDATDALAARDVMAARDARAARAARAAREANGDALLRFAQWCIQSESSWWWGWELSWVACTHLGARQLKDEKVDAWALPAYDAFLAGVWFVYWTETTLYWIAKPRVHKEENPRRLHCADGPALESDVENLYFWHGVLVPAFVVVNPEWITLDHIKNEDNAEVRRVMVERYGEERYIIDSGMKATAHDERFGTIYHEPQQVGTPIAKVKVINRSPEPDGSFRSYWLDINPAHYGGDAGRIPQAAVASTWRTKDGKLAFKTWRDYAPTIET